MPLKRLILLLALLCGTLAQAAPPEQPPPIRVGYIEFAPYTYTDAQGQPAGELIEFLRLVAQRAGYQTQFLEYPSYRLFKSMKTGQIELCASLINHPVMAAYSLRSRYRVAQIKLNLYYKDQPQPPRMEALRDTRLLLIQGLVYPGSPLAALSQDPANGVILARAPTHQAAVQMMHFKRADYLLDYQTPTEAAFEAARLPALPFVTVLQQDFTLAYAQASPRARQLRDALDSAMDQLRAQGQLPEKFRGIAPYAIEPPP